MDASTPHVETSDSAFWSGLRQRGVSHKRALKFFLSRVREWSDCEAAGLRLINDDGNLPFDVTVGFHPPPLTRSAQLSLHGRVCLCQQLLLGLLDRTVPWLTAGGSLVVGTRDELRRATRPFGPPTHLCPAGSTIETVALTPIRTDEYPLGLLYLADSHPHRLVPRVIARIESLTSHLARELVMDAMWPPEVEADADQTGRAICPLCQRWRDRDGRWRVERRRKPRVAFPTVRRARRVICAHCLPYHNTE